MTFYRNTFKHTIIGSAIMIMFFASAVSAQDVSYENEDDVMEYVGTATGDPCPDPKTALSETPNDLNLIQEDITRFTLCLQRAQLLERLNSLAKENIETIESSLMDEMQFNLPTSAMPQQSAPSLPNDIANQQQNTPVKTVSQINWKIDTINGQGDLLSATLVDENQNKTIVKIGDNIPNTETKIMAITSVGVKVKDGNSQTFLKWAN